MRDHGSPLVTGGLAALAAGAMWVVKSATILAVDRQPPVLFDAALPLFGVTVAWLASGDGPSRVRRSAQVAGVVAAVAGTVAVASELFGDGSSVAIVVAAVGFISGLVLVGLADREDPWPEPGRSGWPLSWAC